MEIFENEKYLAKTNPNKTIKEHSDDLIRGAKKLRDLNYINEEDYKLLLIGCKYHDAGKANIDFQNRIKGKTNWKTKKQFGVTGGEVPHNVLSVAFVPNMESKEEYTLVIQSILNHHHFVDNYKYMYSEKETIKNSLKEFEINKFVIRKYVKKNVIEGELNKREIILNGMLNKCDYSASGEFEIEYKNDFLEEKLNGLGYEWNELQKFCIENREKNIIAIAQTGMGKTEGGLLWVGNNKGFFVLPLKTAINAIYERIKEKILDNENVEKRVGLLHSDMLSKYNEHSKKNSTLELEIEQDSNRVLEYANASKNFSMPVMITTLDQLFKVTFKYIGYEYKLATLSYSKVVIDEIQMYSSDLLSFLIYGLKMINEVGGKFAIVTATLPPFVLDLINKKIKGANIEYKEFVNEQKRHNIKVLEETINIEFIKSQYKNNRSKKILVVCNTVREAQKIYKQLVMDGICENTNMLHSKYIRKDRSKKERDILEFGKTYKEGSGIWVTTQVVEASLDIDFDILITELMDINSFFQRLGRCNRKGVKPIDNYNVYLFLNIPEKLLTREDSKGNIRGFIDSDIYEISRSGLKLVDGLLDEKTKLKIIQENLTTEKVIGSHYMKTLNESYNYIEGLTPGEMERKDADKYFRNIVNTTVIPSVVFEENKEEINKYLDISNDKKMNVVERIKAKELIKEYTVSVMPYEALNYKEHIEMERERIIICDCNYSEEIGFEAIKKGEEKEESLKEKEENSKIDNSNFL